MFMVLMSGVVSANILIESHNVSLPSSEGVTYGTGIIYKPNYNQRLINFIINDTTSKPTRCQVYNETSGHSLLYDGSMGGTLNCTTNLNIYVGETYYLVVHSSGSTYNEFYGSGSYPHNLIAGNFTGGVQNSSGSYSSDTSLIRNVLNITTDDLTIESEIIQPYLISPVHNDHSLSYFQNFTFNYTSNETAGSCQLWTNETGTFALEEILTTGLTINTTLNISHTFTSDGTYLWNIGCNSTNLNTTFATSNYTLTLDTVQPYIYPDDISTNNKIAIFNLEGQINLSDEHLFDYNASVNGTNIASESNIGVVLYQYNYTYDVTSYPIGTYNFSIQTCDGHTAKKLKEKWDIDYSGDDLEFITGNKGFSIASDDFDLFDDFTTEKLFDRYTFTYKISNNKNKYTFVVEADTEIFIPDQNKGYNGWIVIPKIGTNGRWVDFNLKNVPNPIYKIIRLGKNRVKVEISNIPKSLDELQFESTGELNCNEATYNWLHKGQLNITALDIVTSLAINTFDVYVGGVLNGSTTNGSFYINPLDEQSYLVKVMATGYATSQQSVSVTQTSESVQFSMYTQNSINVTIRDEVDNSIVDDVNVSLNFLSDSFNYTYSTDNGTIYLDDLGAIEYTIRYRSENQSGTYGSRFRHYVFSLTNDTHNELTLYLISSPDINISVIAYDQTTLNKLENVVVYLQRRFSHDNVYRTTAMYETDLAGTAYFEVNIDEYYKFLADYPLGERKYNSEKLYFESDTYNIYLDLNSDVGDKWFEEDSITFNLNYLDTKEFQGTYSDTEGVATEFCLYLKKYVQYGQTTVNSSCSTSSSGTLEVGGMNENITYYGTLTAKIGGDERIVASAWKEFVEDELDSGEFGYFMTAVLVMVFTFLSIIHVVALILGVLALMFAKLLGLFILGWSEIIVIFIVSIFLAMIIQLVKR